jgi:hypothetical protein
VLSHCLSHAAPLCWGQCVKKVMSHDQDFHEGWMHLPYPYLTYLHFICLTELCSSLLEISVI